MLEEFANLVSVTYLVSGACAVRPYAAASDQVEESDKQGSEIDLSWRCSKNYVPLLRSVGQGRITISSSQHQRLDCLEPQSALPGLPVCLPACQPYGQRQKHTWAVPGAKTAVFTVRGGKNSRGSNRVFGCQLAWST